MLALRANLAAFAGEDGGATAIEYGLIAALLAIACISAMTVFGGSLMGLFNYVKDTGTNAMDNAGI
jgi:pilus assembly protein Flp/PilA